MKDSTHENIQNSNIKDIFLRNASLSVIDVLNRHVIIELIRNEKIEKHSIPFFYNFGGDKQLMQDFFIDLPDGCSYPTLAEGNYDVVPRGSVTLKSFAIKSSDITNRFVRGSFTQEELNRNEQRVMKAYSSRMFTLPMDLKFEVKIKSDNMNKTFKIMEKMFDFYYKNRVIYFQYRGIRIPGQLQMPDSMGHDKKYEFLYSDDTYVKNTFEMSLETYYPSFDDSSTFYKGNRIDQFNVTQKNAGSGNTIDDIFIDRDAPKTE